MLTSSDRNVVGWSRWHFTHPLTEHEKGAMNPDLFDDISHGANKALFQEWLQPLEKLEFKYIDRENDYCSSSFPSLS